MNTELRKQAKTDFEKHFFKLMKRGKRGNKLVLEPNYHTTKYLSENLLAIEMKKIKVKTNKPVYLVLPILEISKTVM